MVNYKPFTRENLVNLCVTLIDENMLDADVYQIKADGKNIITYARINEDNAFYLYNESGELASPISHSSGWVENDLIWSLQDADKDNGNKVRNYEFEKLKTYGWDVYKPFLDHANRFFNKLIKGSTSFPIPGWGGRNDMVIQVFDERADSRYLTVPYPTENGKVIAQNLGFLTEIVNDDRLPRPTALWELLYILEQSKKYKSR